MALIGEIRKNSWLLVVLLALGLVGFIMMDMTSGQTSVFGSDAATMADINGRKLSINEFNRTEQLLYRNSGGDTYSQREFLYNYYIDETLLQEEAEKVGLGVTRDELVDLQFGTTNVSPIIQQRFRDPSTFQVDRARLDGFKQAIEEGTLTDPSVRAYWAHQEKEIKTDRIKTKLSNIVSKGMYVPTWQAEMASEAQYQTVDIAYVQLPFDAIDNSDISLSDQDYAAYLADNRVRYEQEEETRRVQFATFNVQPSPADTLAIRKRMEKTAQDFAAAEDDIAFMDVNYGAFDPVYQKKTELDAAFADTLTNMSAGSVYGPYIKNGAYEIVKLIDSKIIPDSVQARHILINGNDPQTLGRAARTIDSLKTLIESGEQRFDSLAVKLSDDPGSGAKGGVLDYAAPGRMVKPFNDVLFYTGEPDSLYVVASQFGVHLIEILGRKYETNERGYQVGVLNEPIIPSEETQNALYQQALEFASKNRTTEQLAAAVAADDRLEIQTSPALEENGFSVGSLGGGQSSRDIIRWAFSSNAKVGVVSSDVYIYQDQVNYFNNKYAIVALQSIAAAGLPPVASLREDIEPQVINVKKTEQLLSAAKGKDMKALAQQYDTSVDTTKNLNFTSGFIAGLGNEPNVIARAVQMNQGDVSEPIAGENGVYVIKVINKPKNINPTNVAQFRKSVGQGTRAQVPFQLPQSLRETANIDDNRSRFY
ncbi:MAG: peptidylprolyl isomerase [Bacteroidota bacterium]